MFSTIRSAIYISLLIAVLAGTQTTTPAQTPQPTIAQRIAAAANRLDINTATLAQLKSLPGISDALAARIIAGRPYTSKVQLVSRGIITHAMYDNITDKIIAHHPKPNAAAK